MVVLVWIVCRRVWRCYIVVACVHMNEMCCSCNVLVEAVL